MAAARRPYTSAMGSRIAALGCALALGCGAASATTPAPDRIEETPLDHGAVLPAGLWFRLPYVPCEGCEEPAFAVGRRATTLDELEAAMRGLSAEDLAPGYPLAVVEELLAVDPMPATPGLVAVAGLFAERAAADRWATALGLDVSALITEREFRARDREIRMTQTDWADHVRTLVQLDSDAPVAGFCPADIEHLERNLGMRAYRSFEHYLERQATAVRTLAPICDISPATLTVLTGRRDIVRFHRQWAPARCPDGRTAAVGWTQTRLDTLVRRDEEGAVTLEQVVLVECDTASFGRWRWHAGARDRDGDDDGRLALVMRGCGG